MTDIESPSGPGTFPSFQHALHFDGPVASVMDGDGAATQEETAAASATVFVPAPTRNNSWDSAFAGMLDRSMQEPLDAEPAPWGAGNGGTEFSYRDILGDFGQQSRTVFLAVLPSGHGSATPTQVLTPEGTWEVELSARSPTPADLDDNTPVRAVLAYCSAPHANEEEDIEGAPRGRRARKRLPLAFALVKSCSRVDVLTRDTLDTCTVCLENLQKGQWVRTMPCFHRLHDKCSAKYFRSRGILPLCPVCRSYLGVYM